MAVHSHNFLSRLTIEVHIITGREAQDPCVIDLSLIDHVIQLPFLNGTYIRNDKPSCFFVARHFGFF